MPEGRAGGWRGHCHDFSSSWSFPPSSVEPHPRCISFMLRKVSTLCIEKHLKKKKKPFESFQWICSGANESTTRDVWSSLSHLYASCPISNLLSVLIYGLWGACLHFVLILTQHQTPNWWHKPCPRVIWTYLIFTFVSRTQYLVREPNPEFRS